MKILIQHTFNSGLGDFLNCIYEYFETCENLKKIGYNDFRIKFFLDANVYLHKDSFFDFFKKETFESIFNDIEIIDKPIKEFEYDGMETNSNPGTHLWDLFVEKGHEININSYIVRYSYVKPKIEYIDIFTDKIIKKYESIKKQYIGDNYVSIYYRTLDLQEQIESYDIFKNHIDDFIKNNDKIYVSSNSFLFKEYIKKYGDKILMYKIPGEDAEESNNLINGQKTYVGNHYNYNRVFYNQKDLIHERTEFVIFEMLTLSDSKEINFYTTWGRSSNFLLLSKIKKVPTNFNTL